MSRLIYKVEYSLRLLAEKLGSGELGKPGCDITTNTLNDDHQALDRIYQQMSALVDAVPPYGETSEVLLRAMEPVRVAKIGIVKALESDAHCFRGVGNLWPVQALADCQALRHGAILEAVDALVAFAASDVGPLRRVAEEGAS